MDLLLDGFLFKNLNRKKGLFSPRSCLRKINNKCAFSWKQKLYGAGRVTLEQCDIISCADLDFLCVEQMQPSAVQSSGLCTGCQSRLKRMVMIFLNHHYIFLKRDYIFFPLAGLRLIPGLMGVCMTPGKHFNRECSINDTIYWYLAI